MKITKVDIHKIELPLKEPFIISYARYDVMPAIIVKVYTDNGLVGYGESLPDEHVTGESVHSVLAALKYQLIPAILGKDPRNIQQLHTTMDGELVGNGAAKAALDIACYDLLGKYSNLPIYSLLGGRKHEDPTIPMVLSILEPNVLAKQAKEAIRDGYHEIKMKLGVDFEADIERVRAVREAVGPNILIRIDVNQGWGSIQVAKQMIERLSEFRVTWIEQPIKAMDVSLFRSLKESSNTPLMADESMVSPQDLRTLIEHRSVDYINIKLMKCGGIYPAYQLATQASLFGIKCQIGSMVESSIASSAGFHVALAKENIISTELSGPTKFTTDIGDLTYSLPKVNMTDRPGLGIHIKEDTLFHLSIAFEEVII
ncbi:MAG: mandelate racemase/muconate lactonizing enzyme family protein [Bacillota bacterium]